MRIGFANWTSQLAGGAEQYIRVVANELARLGHAVALVHETEDPANREKLMPADAPTWNIAQSGESAVIGKLREWKPDVLYVQMLRNTQTERAFQTIRPAVRFVHDYSGTCISGYKTHFFPAPTPCAKRFDASCLLLYYPRRCGGLNPMTAFTDYRKNHSRLRLLRGYDAVFTNSSHMRAEQAKHGIQSSVFPFPVSTESKTPGTLTTIHGTAQRTLPSRILFAGRMDKLKGVDYLLEAAALAADSLERRIALTLSGDGPYRQALESHVQEMAVRRANVIVRFTGWLDRDGLQRELGRHDVIAVPSVWPEPLGAVGIEAGRFGVPAVAFSVGGISDWLKHGVNGFLAPATPPTAAGLAQALTEVLISREVHEKLCAGAIIEARKHDTHLHVAGLVDAFQQLRP